MVVGDGDGRMTMVVVVMVVVVVNNLLVSRPTSVPRRSINLRINEPAALSAREYFCVIRTGPRDQQTRVMRKIKRERQLHRRVWEG